MKIYVFLFFFFFHWISCQEKSLFLQKNDSSSLKIAFGSCNKFSWDDDSSIFYSIRDYHPDVYIWLGDAAYVEDMILWFVEFEFPGVERARRRLFNSYYDPPYQAMKNETTVIGVWDNHDYGQDWGSGDHNFPFKKEMQQVFLDFLEENIDSPRRKQEGIYDYYDIRFGRRSIRIILLDVRYHKTYKDFLGDAQWTWLESLFKNNENDLVLIGSGSQILSEDRMFHDTWSPDNKYRLLKLIQDYSIPAVLLTGDIHQGEIQMQPQSQSTFGYNLYEITSSGLTHTSKTQFKHGHLIDKLFFPFTYNENGENDRYLDLNFGTIEIILGSEPSEDKTLLQVRDFQGDVKLERTLHFKEMRKASEIKRQEIWRPRDPNLVIFVVNWLNYTIFDPRIRELWWLMAVTILVVFYLIFSFYLTICYILRKIMSIIIGLRLLGWKKRKNQKNLKVE